MARVITDETNVDSEDVVVRKVVPRERTSALAVIVLIAFFATCAVVFFGAIRAPGDVAPPPAAAPAATAPAPAPTTTAP